MRRTFIAAALAAVVFAGCGGDDDAEPLALSSPEDGALEFDKTELTAPAGSVSITYSNPSQVPHAVALEGNGVEEVGETVTASEAPPLTAELEPGTYTFYCPVGNHRAAGMEGTLTVE
jgi:plastocyanin